MKNFLKRILIDVTIIAAVVPIVVSAATTVGWNTPTATTGWILPNPVNGTNQTIYAINGIFASASSTFPASLLHIPGIADGCVNIASGILGSTGSACGAGSATAPAFTPTSYGASTSTTIGFLGGLFSTASTTLSGNTFFTALSQGVLYTGSAGKVNTVATSTLSGSGVIAVTAGAYTLGATPISITCPTCGTGTVASGLAGQLGYYNTTGTTIQGTSTNPLYVDAIIGTSTTISNTFASRVGVATTTPYGTLSVNAAAQINPYFVIGSSTSQAFSVSPSLTGNGTFTISTSTSGCAQFSAVGQLYSTGTNCGSGSGITAYDAFTHPQVGFSATTSSLVIGTSTAATNVAGLTIGSSTAAQLGLFAGTGIVGWVQRNAGGNLYFATTTVAGTATSSPSALSINGTTGNTGVGLDNPGAKFAVSFQSIVQAPVSGSLTQFVGLDANPLRITFDTNNSGTSGTALMFRNSGGTAATPAATVANAVLGSLNFRGYGATGYGAGSTALMTAKNESGSVFTDTSMPTAITFDTTPPNSITATEKLRITGAGLVGIATTTPQYLLTVSTSTAPQFSLSVGAGFAQTVFRNDGTNFYIATTTVAGNATTSISALEIALGGFGTTTVRGLNITGQATSTSNVGFNITNGCYAIGGTCLSTSGGSGITSYDAWTHSPLFLPNSATTSKIAIGTTTPYYSLTVASTTGPQLALSSGVAGQSSWAFRTAGSNFYIASTTVLGTATTTTASLAFEGATTTLEARGAVKIADARIFQVGNGTNYVPTGGGDPRYIIIDKSSDAQDASLLYGSNGVLKWEVGLPGDNDFHWKSITGTESGGYTFTDRLFMRAVDGAVGYGTSVPTGAMEVATSAPSIRAQLTVTNKNAGAGTKGAQLVLSNASWSAFFSTDVGLNGNQNLGINWGSFGTGLFMDSSANIGIQNAATNIGNAQLTIGSSNNGVLAISTSTPGCLAIVNSFVYSTGTACGSGAGGIADPFTHPQVGFSATTSSLVVGTSTAATNLAGFTVGSSTASQLGLFAGTGIAGWTFRNAGGNLYISTTTVAGNATTSVSAISVLNSGNVGIGTTTPTSLLSVASSTSNLGSLFSVNFLGTNSITKKFEVLNDPTYGALTNINTDVNIGTSNGLGPFLSAVNIPQNGTGIIFNPGFANTGITNNSSSAGSGITLKTSNATGDIAFTPNAIQSVIFKANGNVGIGTSTPYLRLNIASTTQPQLALEGNDTDSIFTFRSIGSQLYISTSSPTTFATSSTAALALSTGMGISVSTTTPSATYAFNTAAGQDALAIGSSTSEYMRISSLGKVFFPGATLQSSAATNYWCYDAGGQLIRVSNTCTISALKFKKDITPLTQGLDTVLAMKPVNYYLNDLGLGSDPTADQLRQQIGFVADYSATTTPLLVLHDGIGEIHGFNYEQYTAILTKAIQDLNTKVENMKVGKVARSAEENWQDIVIGLLILGFLYQGYQIKKLKHGR